MMLAKAAAKLIPRDKGKPEKDLPWANAHADDERLRKPHGPAVEAERVPTSRKAPLSFHRPTGRK